MQAGAVETFIVHSDLAKVLPFKQVDTVQINTRRENTLPATGWAARGVRFIDGGVPGFEYVTDSVYSLGGEYTIDKIDKMDKGPWVEEPLARAIRTRIKSMAYNFHNMVINGDHATEPDAPEGVKVRVNNMAAAQTVYANTSTSQLDLRAGFITNALAYQFLDAIDNVRYALDGRKADICLTDIDFIQAFKRSLRQIGNYVAAPGTPVTVAGARGTSAEPPNPQSIFEWDGTKYIDMGFKADQTTKVVATTTVNSVACRPAYFLRMDEKEYFHALSMQDLTVSDPFMLDDGRSWRVVIDMIVGFRHVHPKSISQLLGTYVVT